MPSYADPHTHTTHAARTQGLHCVHGLWDTMRSVCGERTAVLYPHVGGGEGGEAGPARLTYEEAAAGMEALAGALQVKLPSKSPFDQMAK